MLCQKERSDIILINEEIDDSQQNKDYIKNCIETCFLYKSEENELVMKEIYLLSQLLNKYNYIELKEMNNNEIITYLKEIIDILKPKNIISPYICGIINYKLIINNLQLILELISNKFNSEEDYLITFILILRDICYYNFSIQLKFILMKKLKEKLNILKDTNIDYKDVDLYIKSYIPFEYINNEMKFKLAYFDFPMFLDNHDFKNEIDNVNIIDLNNHWTLISGKYLFLFVQNPYKLKMNRENQFIILFQIDLELNKVVNFRKIALINEEKAKTEKLIDINISIKKDIIYLFYIIKYKYNDKIKYYLKYKIYNNTMINLNNKEENNHIEFSEFIPIRLINDSKYLCCFSTTEKFFVLKLNCKFNQFNISKYAICKFDFKNFKMYNTFYIHNYLIIENIENNKQYSAIINKNINEEYTFKIIEIKNEKELEYNKNNNFIINITFNDNKYVITKIDKKKLLLYYKVIENDGKNEYFSFPFSDSYLNYQTDNCYDKYLKEICFILNMFGNNNKNSIINIIQISSYFKLMKNDLDYIIQNIKNNKEFDKVKL